MQEYKFINFRKTKLKDFLNEHRDHKIEQVIGESEDNTGFRFIKCEKCKLAYFVGMIEGNK